MKKTLIALAIATLPAAASADVVLYGQVKAGVETAQYKVGTEANGGGSNTAALLESKRETNTAGIADFGSRIGFKGQERLGNGLNAIWQIEQKTSVAGTDSNWGNRQSFIGLESQYGKLRAGRLDSSVKNTSDAIDQWEYNNSALGLGYLTRVDERLVSVRYDSPSFAGFSANVQYAPRDNQNPDNRYKHDEAARDTYYAGLNYENAGFFGQYAGGFRKNAVKAGKDGQLHRLVAGYDANNLLVAVAGQYGKNWESLGDYAQALSNGLVSSKQREAGMNAANVVFGTPTALENEGVETTEVAATAAYRFGNITPRVSYAHGFKAKAAGETLSGTQYDQVIVGADYDFSKRTTAFATAGWSQAGENGPHRVQTTAGLVGLRHKF